MIEPLDPAGKTDNTAPNAGTTASSSLGPSLRPPASSTAHSASSPAPSPGDAASRDLQRQVQALRQEIAELQETRNRLVEEQAQGLQAAVTQLVESGLTELEQRRKSLQTSVDQLERRQERIQAEMRKSFVGVSQDLAVRVQGFKEYLVGSLQDLATTAEQLELGASGSSVGPTGQALPRQQPKAGPRALAEAAPEVDPAPLRQRPPSAQRSSRSPSRSSRALRLSPPLDEAPPRRDEARPQTSVAPPDGTSDDLQERIRQLLEQYRTMPNYYGRPWQLRRTFEPVHAERVSQWFFDLGQRGAIKTMGSRLQNVLIASAAISALREIHGDRIRALILGDSPERLGEWRRGLQDCLGISRTDFGAQRGVVLFEAPEALAQRAERLVAQDQMPLILIDEGEDKVSLSLLQFPLWLAFAPDPADTLSLY